MKKILCCLLLLLAAAGGAQSRETVGRIDSAFLFAGEDISNPDRCLSDSPGLDDGNLLHSAAPRGVSRKFVPRRPSGREEPPAAPAAGFDVLTADFALRNLHVRHGSRRAALHRTERIDSAAPTRAGPRG